MFLQSTKRLWKVKTFKWENVSFWTNIRRPLSSVTLLMKNENMRISILWGRHWSCVCPPPISVWSCIDWGDKRDKTWWPRIRSQLNISNHQPTQDNTICGFLGLFVDMTSPIGGMVSFLYFKLQSSANMHLYYYFSDTNRSCNSMQFMQFVYLS